MCPLCPVLLAGCGLLTASKDAEVWFSGGLRCSVDVQVGEKPEEEEEEEEGRGRSGGEAGGPVGFSFSIMVVKSLGESRALVPLSCPECVLPVCVVASCPSLYVYENS